MTTIEQLDQRVAKAKAALSKAYRSRREWLQNNKNSRGGTAVSRSMRRGRVFALAMLGTHEKIIAEKEGITVLVVRADIRDYVRDLAEIELGPRPKEGDDKLWDERWDKLQKIESTIKGKIPKSVSPRWLKNYGDT